MQQHTYQNLKGTTSKDFTIGKSGVNLMHRSAVPDNSEGINGKSYCFILDGNPRIMFKQDNEWVDVGRTLIVTADTARDVLPVSPRTMVMVKTETAPFTVTVPFIPPIGHEILFISSDGFLDTNPLTIVFEQDGVSVQTETMDTNETLSFVSTGLGMHKF